MARRYSIKMCHSWCGVTNTYRLHKIVRRESPVKNRADNDIVILIPLPIVHKIVMDTPDFFILLFGCRKNETIYCTIPHRDNFVGDEVMGVLCVCRIILYGTSI